jgi:hypothetical protein
MDPRAGLGTLEERSAPSPDESNPGRPARRSDTTDSYPRSVIQRNAMTCEGVKMWLHSFLSWVLYKVS